MSGRLDWLTWRHAECGEPWWRHKIIGRDVEDVVCPERKRRLSPTEVIALDLIETCGAYRGSLGDAMTDATGIVVALDRAGYVLKEVPRG